MKILLAHSYYQQSGGEDTVFARETKLLLDHGHEIITYTLDNKRANQINAPQLGLMALWNHETYSQIEKLIVDEEPDLIHIHNTFPLISPSIYYPAQKYAIPVIQRLPNYRLLCNNALFFRNGQICEDCLGKTPPWPGVLHACYRDSRIQTSVVALMLTLHRWLKTWQKKVDVYIALNEFSRQKFINGGLPSEKIRIKPNFVSPDPGAGQGKGCFALFVGRLSAEKGIDTLLQTWEVLGSRIHLKIIGDGPLAHLVQEVSQRDRSIQWLGRQPTEFVLQQMGEASFLIFPSRWYEVFPVVMVEAFAKGTPVITTDLGALSEIVTDGVTGFLFPPGNAEKLAELVTWLLAHPQDLVSMRHQARAEYEAKYTAEKNHHILMDIYSFALKNYRK